MPTAEGNGQGAVVVPPQPLPEVAQVCQWRTGDGALHVRLDFLGPHGQDVHFLEGPVAEVIGKELCRLAGPTAAGLEVPARG